MITVLDQMEKKEKLEEIWSHTTESSVCFILGEKGLGKKELLDSFLADKHTYIRVLKVFESSYYLEPVVNALHTYLRCSSSLEMAGLSMVESVSRQLIDICVSEPIILAFEGINFYDLELTKYICQIVGLLLNNYSSARTFFLFTIDTDAELSPEQTDQINKLYELTSKISFIHFALWTKEQLCSLLCNSICPSLEVSRSDDLEYMVSAAFHNPSRMRLVANYLKQEGYISQVHGKWICRPLPEGVLDDVVKRYVMRRYQKLEENLRTVLQKSALLGYEFSMQELRSSFQLIHASQDLMRIEKISKLISSSESGEEKNYVFETHEVYRIIHDKIPKEECADWCRLLSAYYELKLSKNVQTEAERCYICKKLAFFLRESNQLEKSLKIYMQGIISCVNLLDYKQAEIMIEEACEIAELLIDPPIKMTEFILKRAQCADALGNYEKAIQDYQTVLKDPHVPPDLIMDVNYYFACALYNYGEIERAKHILENLEKDHAEGNDLLLLRIKSELATIYHFQRDYGKAGQAFKQSLHLCEKVAGKGREFYIQIRKSSMFWALDLSQSHMKEGAAYFKKVGDLKEYAKTAHNIGADMLWLKDLQAEEYLLSAKEAFLKFGSNCVQYTFNCLGIYQALFRMDYEAALHIFETADKNFFTDTFSQLALALNCANCFLALSDFDRSFEYLNKAENIRRNFSENIPSYSLYFLIDMGLYYKRIGNYEKCSQYLIQSLEHRLLNSQQFLVGQNLLLCEQRCGPLKIEHGKIVELARCQPHNMYRHFFEHDVCFGTLRFWE